MLEITAQQMRKNALSPKPEGCTFLDQLDTLGKLVEKATDVYESW
jgi:hypothetical protein